MQSKSKNLKGISLNRVKEVNNLFSRMDVHNNKGAYNKKIPYFNIKTPFKQFSILISGGRIKISDNSSD